MQRPTTQRGFTLIEMMVVVTIISILVALAVNLRTTTYGANTASVADQVVSELEFARMRAISTRHYERVLVTNTKLTISEGNTTGMTTPASFTQFQQMVLPVSVKIWDHTTASDATAGSHLVGGLDAALSFPITFRPDGSLQGTTGATLYLSDAGSDTNATHTFRVIVYRISGSVYARTPW